MHTDQEDEEKVEQQHNLTPAKPAVQRGSGAE
jgi:hypothetical protein